MHNELVLEKQASHFRSNNGFNNFEPIVVKSLLQKNKVVTIFKPLSDNFSGMALKIAADNQPASRFILINSSQSIGKQHFTICHELYHLFIQENFTSQVCKTGRFDKKADPIEYLADVFASYLLMPTDGIKLNIPDEELDRKKISLSTILYLEQLYSCSRRALLVRLKVMGLITPQEFNAYCEGIKRSAIESGYTTLLYEPGNHNLVIGDYGQIAKDLYNKNKISESHYYSLLADLGIDWSKIDNLTDGE